MSERTIPIRDAIGASLDSVETALARLLDSVAAYNPSPQAAAALVQADEALAETLETLEYHQASHNRILELRSTTSALDDQLTELLTALSETRQEILKCPGTTFDNNPRDIPYTELLEYAAKISKFSQPANPATFRKQVLAFRAAEQAAQVQQQQQQPQAQNPQQPQPQLPEGENTQDQDKETEKEKLPLGLSAEDALLADPFSGHQFAPWPSEQEMKSGALVTLQNGQLPWDMVSEEEREKVLKEREREERRARGEYVPEVEDGELVDGVREDKTSAVAVGGGGGGQRPGGAEVTKPKVNLSLDLYDPDED